MHFQEDLVAAHGEQDRLVDHPARRSDHDAFEQPANILGPETDAAVRDGAIDARRRVGTMNANAWVAQSEPELAERIVRARRNDRRKAAAGPPRFLAN